MCKKRIFRFFLASFSFFFVFANIFAAPKVANIADTYNKSKSVEQVDALLQKGGDINEWAKGFIARPQSAMHFAAEDPTLANDIRELAKRGANVNAFDAMGRTPLHIAAIYKNDKAVEVLLELGADPSIIDVEGLTPAEHALMTAKFVPYGNSLMLPKVISPED
jgi:ankyrin repeat protein